MPKRVLIPFRHATKVAAYVEAVKAAGAEPVVADVSEPLSLQDIQGLLLMGGTDVNPSLYGAAAQVETEPPDDARDFAEMDIIERAFAKDLPLFAICRGLQMLNVFCGGTLIQHLPGAVRHDVCISDKSQPVHNVRIVQGSRLAQIARSESLPVNSRHHQAADKLGMGLRVVAQDDQDGTIEALEHAGKRFVLGVQWHPEDQVFAQSEQLALFQSFAAAL